MPAEKSSGVDMNLHVGNLHVGRDFTICRLGSRRTALSPTWSGPEGSSHNDFVPGRRLPPLAMAIISA
jgi:hypothetical protein